MKRSFLFLLAGLILILCTAQTEARTYFRARTVTAPALYWNFYNGYYAPMAARAYNSVPPIFRPVRVYQQPVVVPQPVYTSPGYAPQQPVYIVPQQKYTSRRDQFAARLQKLVAQRKKAAEERKKVSAQRKKANEARRAKLLKQLRSVSGSN